MANTASNRKRVRSTKRKAAANALVKEKAKTLLKEAKKALDTKSVDAAEKVAMASRQLDKAQQKRLLHKNNVARHKSRLSKKLNSLDQDK